MVGTWRDCLDAVDRSALRWAVPVMSRADLYATICAAYGDKPFSLTALKDDLNGRCVCD